MRPVESITTMVSSRLAFWSNKQTSHRSETTEPKTMKGTAQRRMLGYLLSAKYFAYLVTEQQPRFRIAEVKRHQRTSRQLGMDKMMCAILAAIKQLLLLRYIVGYF